MSKELKIHEYDQKSITLAKDKLVEAICTKVYEKVIEWKKFVVIQYAYYGKVKNEYILLTSFQEYTWLNIEQAKSQEWRKILVGTYIFLPNQQK